MLRMLCEAACSSIAAAGGYLDIELTILLSDSDELDCTAVRSYEGGGLRC